MTEPSDVDTQVTPKREIVLVKKNKRLIKSTANKTLRSTKWYVIVLFFVTVVQILPFWLATNGLWVLGIAPVWKYILQAVLFLLFVAYSKLMLDKGINNRNRIMSMVARIYDKRIRRNTIKLYDDADLFGDNDELLEVLKRNNIRLPTRPVVDRKFEG